MQSKSIRAPGPDFTSQSPLRLKLTEHTTQRKCDRMSEHEHLLVREGEYFSLDILFYR